MTSQAIFEESSQIDRYFMRRVLALARRPGRKMVPNPRVAALVVKDQKILGRGLHTQAGGKHAEVMALEQAGDLALGATLYVNLEPCNHFGHTPPCTQAIIQAGIARVVVGCLDPNPNVCGGGNQSLESAGIEVLARVLEEESQAINTPWLHWIQTGRPYVYELEVEDGRSFARSLFWQRLKRDIDIVVLSEKLEKDFENNNLASIPFVVGENPEVLIEKGIFFELIQSVMWIRLPKV